MIGFSFSPTAVRNKLQFGPELVPDGRFNNGIAGWLPGLSTTLTHDDGSLRIFCTGGGGKYPKAQLSLGTLEAGQPYRLVVGKSVRAPLPNQGNQHRVGISTVPSAGDDAFPASVMLATGSTFDNDSAIYVPGGTGEHFLFLFAQDFGGATIVHYDNISLKKVLG